MSFVYGGDDNYLREFLVQISISYQIYSLDYLTSQNYMSYTLSALFLFHRIIWLYVYLLPSMDQA